MPQTIDSLPGSKQAARQRSVIKAEIEQEASSDDDDDQDEDSTAKATEPGREIQGSMKAVKGLCSALDRRVRMVRW